MTYSCSICFNSYCSHDVVATPCGHVFHYECIGKWVDDNELCPECRGEVTRDNVTKLFFNTGHQETVRPSSTLKRKLASKKAELKEKKAELVSREAELVSREAELESKEAELESKEAELESKEAELESKEAELESKEAELESKEAELESKEAELREKLEELDSKTLEVAKLETEKENSDNENLYLQSQVKGFHFSLQKFGETLSEQTLAKVNFYPVPFSSNSAGIFSSSVKRRQTISHGHTIFKKPRKLSYSKS